MLFSLALHYDWKGLAPLFLPQVSKPEARKTYRRLIDPSPVDATANEPICIVAILLGVKVDDRFAAVAFRALESKAISVAAKYRTQDARDRG